MAVNDLTFTRNALNRWESKFNSVGSPVTVQVNRASASPMVVYANLPGMDPVPIYSVGGNAAKNLIFDVDVPSGTEITVESNVEVLQAKIMG